MIEWKQIGENLVRHPGGNIYLRAKVNGKVVRKSLHTADIRTAKRKRDAELEKIRHAASLGDDHIDTLAKALALEKARTLSKPKLKQATIDYYGKIFGKIEASLPGCLSAADWTTDQARKWWTTHCKGNQSALHANNALSIMRRAMAAVVERGIRPDNPIRVLKRLKVPKTRIDDLPTEEQMDALLSHIRTQGARCADESAAMIEFLAWSGLRISEAQALRWENVGEQWITVTGGKTGTKNHEIRQIPVNSRLRAILDARRYAGGHGPVFHILTPKRALEGACKKLGYRHMRIHDLRHWFTNLCIQRGIDVVTVAAWLGHKDGGKTLLATYAHHQKTHSLASAERLG